MGNNKIINRVGDSVQIDWRNNLHDLQPFNAKRPYNYGALKKSILKYGFSVAFAKPVLAEVVLFKTKL